MSWVKGTSATNGNFNTTTGTAETVSVAVSVGQIVCVAVSTGLDGSLNPPSTIIVSSLGNTYTHSSSNVQDTTQFQRLDLYMAKITVAGTDVLHASFNPTPGTSTAANVTIVADPFTSGGDASSAFDGTGAAANQSSPGTGTDAVSSGLWATSTDGDLIYGATEDTVSGADPGVHGTGFTDGAASSGATTVVVRTEFKTQSTHGSVAGTFTGTTGTDRFITAAFAITPAATILQGRNLTNNSGPGISPDKRKQFLSKRLSSQQTIIAALSGQTILIGVTSGSLTALGYGALRSSGPGISPDYTKLFSARQFGFPQVTAPTPISGQTISISIATGALSGAGALSGEVNCISTFTGALNASGALSGETIALGIGTGLLIGAGALSGESMGLSVGIGSLSSTAPNLSGLSVSLSMGSGALTGVGALSGNVSVISTYTAELDGSVFLSGSTISISAATGLLIASSGTVTDLHQVYFIANVGTLMNR